MKKLGVDLSTLIMPDNLKNDLQSIQDQIDEKRKQIRNLQSNNSKLRKLVIVEGESPSAAAEAKAWKQVGGGAGLPSGSTAYSGINDVRARINELQGMNTEEAAQELSILTKFIEEYDKALQKVSQTATQQIELNNQEIDQRKIAVQALKNQQAEIENQAIAASKEQEIVKQIIDLLNQLSSARNEVADDYDAEKQAQAADIAAKQKNIKAMQAQEQQYQKNVTQLDSANKSQKTNTIELDRNTGVLAKATKQVVTYGTVLNLLKRVYNETINAVRDMDKALTGMAVVTTMSREQT